MFHSSFEFDRDLFINIQRNLIASPKLMQRAMKRREPRLRQLTLKIVKVEPGTPRYPIRWTSQRQRRKVMAMLREENNLPYQRTHALVNAWGAKFQFDESGGAFVVENTSPVATYVVGEFQQRFHDDTGWINAEEVIDNQVVPMVLNDYSETFLVVCDPFNKAKSS